MRRSATIDLLLVLMYLAAIVTANLSVAKWGQVALPFTAFLLIPFDLVTRDVLHERWQGGALWLKMGMLIAGGSVLAAALNVDAWRVALASFIAFGCAQSVNSGVFHLLIGKTPRYLRMNVSNCFAALVDSTVFPVVAFWPTVSVWLVGAQWLSKFIGGLVISAVAVKVIPQPNEAFREGARRIIESGGSID